MSRELISRSPDLKCLLDEGYEVDVVSGHLLVKHVPYVTTQREVRYGTLVSTLALAGERTSRPDTHVVYFIGEQPCHKDGSEIQQLKHQQERKTLADKLEVDRSFSNKPAEGYCDYYVKLTTYVKILSAPAEYLDPMATARTFIVELTDSGSVFEYTDTATTRAAIGSISRRLEQHKVAIVGLGGTGSYVLDLIAKTPVSEIHLFDRDLFLQHNAFRSPGAPSLEQLRASPSKVEYFAAIYSRMHKKITAHTSFLDSDSAEELAGVDFIFLCLDSGRSRKELVDVLQKLDKPFIDVGMGVDITDPPSLIGTVRVSTSSPNHRAGDRRIPTSDGDPDPAYSSNIQIADLNCLSAALAVIRWKKICGFYQDLQHEHLATYAINVNQLLSEEESSP